MGTISQKLTYLNGTKQAIRSAIEANGVYVDDSDTFRSYADKIRNVNTLRIDGFPTVLCDAYVLDPRTKVALDPVSFKATVYEYFSSSSSAETITGSVSGVGVGEYIIAAVCTRGAENRDELTYGDDWQLIHTTPDILASSAAIWQRMSIFVKTSDSIGTHTLTVDYSNEHPTHAEAFMIMFSIHGIRSLEYDNTFDVNWLRDDFQAQRSDTLAPADKTDGEKLIWLMHTMTWVSSGDEDSWYTTPDDMYTKFLGRRIGLFIDFGDRATHRVFKKGDDNNFESSMSCCALRFTT